MRQSLRIDIALIALLVAFPAAATPQLPAVETPDTLGAAFDAEASGRGTPSDYDFLVGEWSFRFQERAEGGEWGPALSGTWTVRKAHDGFIVEDVWRLEGADNPTLTYRVFNPERGVWELQGVRPRTGAWEPGISWSDEDQRFVVQTFDGRLLARIRYYEIRPDRFRWRADGSLDGGETWLRDLWKMDVVRVTRSGSGAPADGRSPPRR